MILTGQHHWKIGLIFWGYCFMKSNKQSSVALSTCKAEYMALSGACQEFAYLTQFMKDVVQCKYVPVKIKNNDQDAIAFIKNPV